MKRALFIFVYSIILSGGVKAQTSDDLLNLLIEKGAIKQDDADSLRADVAIKAAEKASFRPNGKVWGLVFADLLYKGHADSAKRGSLLYSGMAQDSSALDVRRVYLGYEFNISERFSSELLIAHEGAADLLTGGNRGLYLRLANLRWKSIYPRADLVVGQVNSPTVSYVSDKIWAYRSLEKTVSDQRRLGSSNDVGILLQGTIGSRSNYGYNLMVGNGPGPKLENDKFKKLYAEFYVLFWNQKIILDLYADYERTRLKPNYHQSKTTYKAYLAYQSEPITIGVEAIQQIQENASIYTEPALTDPNKIGTKKDTADAIPFAVSVFARGPVIVDKLAAFIRYDIYNPDTRFSPQNFYTSSYTGNIRQTFILGGLDWTPFKIKNVHIMPNVWYNLYRSTNDGAKKVQDGSLLVKDYDLVYRITLHYILR